MKSFFYFVIAGKYAIADEPYIRQSERTVDVFFNELATDTELLNKLNLLAHWSERENAVEGFAFYLSSFGKHESAARQKKLLTNPKLRILIEDKVLFQEIDTYLRIRTRSKLLAFAQQFSPPENIFFIE